MLLGMCVVAMSAAAQVQPGETQYAISVHAGYGHNLTQGSMANFDIDAYMPINTHFDMQANVRLCTENNYAMGLQLRPKFGLPVGELFLENRLMARIFVHEEMNEFVHAISLGYMMEYVSVQVGMTTRMMLEQPYNQHSADGILVEPFGACYRLEAFVRPRSADWNISLCISNMDNYMIERVMAPMFYLGAWYDINDHWRVRLSGKYRLAGMFHLNAHYYGSEVRAGVEVRI